MIQGERKEWRGGQDGKPEVGMKERAVKGKRVFLYALGIAAIGGGAYLLYDRLKRKSVLITSENEPSPIVINNNLPAPTVTSTSVKAITTGDGFPLKRGSRGIRVTQLQTALAKIIGTSAMNTNGGIDGQFGPGTANALKKAGYGEIVDEKAFNLILGWSGVVVSPSFDPKAVATELYRKALLKDLAGVIENLRKISSPLQYSQVNDYYKEIPVVSKTIVNDLLSYAFAANTTARDQIKAEFLRIGLKVDSAGKWSLQGLQLYRDLITLRETVVLDSRNNRIPVRRNTILGDEMRVANGMTWFRSVDDTILKVPTQDVKYT